MEKRRDFIKKLAVASAGMAVGSKSFGFTAKSYRNIIGANDRIHVAIIGLNGRGGSMAKTFAHQKNLEIGTVCDVDSRT
ncbi:MAG: NADH-dependent dehydrogenase, partial [Mucilaginibacter sp.]|nr:NADH-dependent dehydrogenase [Mucilaginibacter sp.]